MATFWERAALSVDHMFYLYFAHFKILVISRFGFVGGIWVLIAPVHGHCTLVTFDKTLEFLLYSLVWGNAK